MKSINSILFLIVCLTIATQLYSQENKPNIVVIMADDIGLGDINYYTKIRTGKDGVVPTPNLDKIARESMRFTDAHSPAPLCAPTRAMVLSGNDNHIAGMGKQSSQNNGFGYEGKLTNRIATIPQILRKSGYHTYMTGKWHLGRDSLSIPFSKGFERSFVNILGAGNHYDDQGLFKEDPITPYFEDGKPANWNNGNYSTDFYTDKLIEYIDLNIEDKKPFFGFAAYTSPHWPLQVDEKYWKKYEGQYDDGYEKLKERRLESLKNAGMIPIDAVLPPNHEKVIPWDSLSLDEKKKESRKMELYAGMVDNLDYNIGRIIQHLKDIGQFENTLIVFMSDNGAAAEDFYYHPNYGPFIRENFNDDYETMGQPNSFISYGPGWAEAGSSPFRHYKGSTTEGGINAPMIISGPNIEMNNEINNEFVTLMDIAPTFYEVAQTTYPEKFEGNDIYPLKGNSLMPFVSGKSDQIHSSEYVFGLEHSSLAMIRPGDWKITNITRPFLEENFKLYNISQDLAEINDLKVSEPEKYKEMLEEWRKFTNEVKVQIPPPSSKE